MPIRLRLALWYGGVFALVLFLFGVLLYLLLEQHLDGMVDAAISSRSQHLVSSIQASKAASTEGFQLPTLDAFQSPEVYVEILDLKAQSLGRSSNLAEVSLPMPRNILTEAAFGAVVTYYPTVMGTQFKAQVAPASVNGVPVILVVVASSYRQKEMVLERFRLLLGSGGLGSVLLAGLVGWAVAGRALQPVANMGETARAIALSRGFSRRLPTRYSNDELDELAVTFNEMLASLETAYTAQQRFTADASHELRAPITAIRGNLDLLERIKAMPDDERARLISQVRTEAERMSRLVDDLLTLARADAGQQISFVPVELDVLVMEVFQQLRAQDPGLELALIALEPVQLQGDPDHLRRLLLNLVNNALQYTPPGGKVTVALRSEHSEAFLAIADTGIGIEPQDIPHIFERFWRADAARSRASGGTGLGLSIAKWIVDQHGGEIRVASTVGQGTSFTVVLPLA